MLALARTSYSQLRKYQRALARGCKKFTVGTYYKRYKLSQSGRLWGNFYQHCIPSRLLGTMGICMPRHTLLLCRVLPFHISPLPNFCLPRYVPAPPLLPAGHARAPACPLPRCGVHARCPNRSRLAVVAGFDGSLAVGRSWAVPEPPRWWTRSWFGVHTIRASATDGLAAPPLS